MGTLGRKGLIAPHLAFHQSFEQFDGLPHGLVMLGQQALAHHHNIAHHALEHRLKKQLI